MLKKQTTDTPSALIYHAQDINEDSVTLSGVYDSTRKGFVTPVNVTQNYKEHEAKPATQAQTMMPMTDNRNKRKLTLLTSYKRLSSVGVIPAVTPTKNRDTARISEGIW